MEIVMQAIVYALKCIYTTLPAGLANAAPVLMRKVPFLNYPMDFNKTIFGKPILGPHKTFRGLFFGIVYSMVVMNIIYLIYKFTGVNWTIFDFEKINFELLGFLMGFGVILGDAVKSFFKRQLNVPPGANFMPWDQIDCALGGLLLGRIAWDFPILYGVTVIVLTFIIQIITRRIMYYIGFNETKW